MPETARVQLSFPADLAPEIREKAHEIATLIMKAGYSAPSATAVATKHAKKWFARHHNGA